MISLDIIENGDTSSGGGSVDDLRSSVIALSNSVVNVKINTYTFGEGLSALSSSISSITDSLSVVDQISSLQNEFNSLSSEFTGMTESIGYLSDSIIQVSDSLTGLIDSLTTMPFSEVFNNQYYLHCNDTFMLDKIPNRGNLLLLSLTSGYFTDTFTFSNKTYDTLYLSGTPLAANATAGLDYYTVLDNCSFKNVINNNFTKMSMTLGGGLLWGKSDKYATINTFDFVDCTPTHDDSRQLFYRYMNISELNFWTNGRCMYPFVDCNISSVSIKPWTDGFVVFKGDRPFRAAMSDCNISTLKAYYGFTDSVIPKGRLFANHCTINSLKVGYPILSNATAAENFLANCTFNRPEEGGSYTILLKESESTLWDNSRSKLTQSFRDFVINPNLSNSYYSATFTLPTHNTTHTTLTLYDFPCTTELYS